MAAPRPPLTFPRPTTQMLFVFRAGSRQKCDPLAPLVDRTQGGPIAICATFKSPHLGRPMLAGVRSAHRTGGSCLPHPPAVPSSGASSRCSYRPPDYVKLMNHTEWQHAGTLACASGPPPPWGTRRSCSHSGTCPTVGDQALLLTFWDMPHRGGPGAPAHILGHAPPWGTRRSCSHSGTCPTWRLVCG
jgi:hypothetical protein